MSRKFFLLNILAIISLSAQAPVTLSPQTAPSTGQPGLTSVTLTGSNFPSGGILPQNLDISIMPTAGGPATIAKATAVANVIGSTRRITFTIPMEITVSAPTTYRISISGTSTTGVAFRSSNTANITVNPVPSVTLVPDSSVAGQSTIATITGLFTNFVQGSTRANFGPGIVVGGAAPGAFGPVTVTSPTSATAQLIVGDGTTLEPRIVTVATGAQVATAVFTAKAPIPPIPSITNVQPGVAPQGTQNFSVSIAAEFTHFQQGVTTADFGPDISVFALAVISPTSATATINIANAAEIGQRDVTLRTNSEVVTAPNGFRVQTNAPTITLTSPANLSYLNLPSTTVTGLVSDPTATVVVNSIQAPVANGNFSVVVPIIEGANILTAVAKTPQGAVATASLNVTLDTTPPHVSIDSPANNFVTSESKIAVRGLVNDIVLGTVNGGEAQVSVNGIVAEVSNRGYLATGVPLALGDNLIQALGFDHAGNGAFASVHVIRQADTEPTISTFSGDNQKGAIGAILPSPLVALVKNAAGQPVPNQPVLFSVTANDGTLLADSTARAVVVASDSLGKASVQWQLGTRAGAGNNAVSATAAGFHGVASFSATALSGTPSKLLVDIGNNQTGATGQALATPFVTVVTDSGDNRLANVPVVFTVQQGGGSFSGASTFTATSDSDGRAQAFLTLGDSEGPSNNAATATLASDSAIGVTFIASALLAGDAAQTTVSGIVLDNSNVPVQGVTMRLYLRNAASQSSPWQLVSSAMATDAQGQFRFAGAPVGLIKLDADGSTAQRPGTWAHLEFEFVTVAGRDNGAGGPIYILPLDTAHQLCVSPTMGGTLALPHIPGFELTVKPDTVTFPGGSRSGCISVTVVHPDKVPMAPSFGIQPRFVVTVQPPGMRIEPPAALQVPNLDGLPPGRSIEMFSFDHDLVQFVGIGPGTVSNDGMVIRSNPGVGVFKGGWYPQAPPDPGGCVIQPGACSVVSGQCTSDLFRIDSLDVLLQASVSSKRTVKSLSLPAIVRAASSSKDPIYSTGDHDVTLDVEIDTNCNDVNYEWDFGDGSAKQTTTTPTVKHRFVDFDGDGISDPDNYTVKVNATCKGTDQSQCAFKSATLKVTIFEIELSTVRVPGASHSFDNRRVPIKGGANQLVGAATITILPMGAKPKLQAKLLAGDGKGPQMDGSAQFDDDSSTATQLEEIKPLNIKGLTNSTKSAQALRLSIQFDDKEVAYTQFAVRTWPAQLAYYKPPDCVPDNEDPRGVDLIVYTRLESESGDMRQVQGIYVGEFVTFPTEEDFYSYPSPPWLPVGNSYKNGFFLPADPNMPGTFASAVVDGHDTHGSGNFQYPIAKGGTFNNIQAYQFRDTLLFPKDDFILFRGFESIAITRGVGPDIKNEKWIYRITKDPNFGCSSVLGDIVEPF